MATVNRPSTRTRPRAEPGFTWLENGERLDQPTFHARYLQMPDDFRAELIEGVVYVSSSRRIGHGRTHACIGGLLFVYSASTPGVAAQNNATTILGLESEPQPDTTLLILSDHGGQSRDGDDDYTHGAPELIVEVALSSRSIDLHAKFRDYERAGVLEYVVFDASEHTLHWFSLTDGRFVPLPASDDGLFRSLVFPGLWIDPEALARDDKAALLAALHRGLQSPEHAVFVGELQRRKAEHDGNPS